MKGRLIWFVVSFAILLSPSRSFSQGIISIQNHGGIIDDTNPPQPVPMATAGRDDSAAGPVQLMSAGGVVTSNTSATRDPGEPAIPGDPEGRTLWYRWTARSNGLLQVTFPTQAQHVIAGIAEDGPIESLQWLAHNAHRVSVNGLTVWRSRPSVSIPVRAGKSYLLAIDTQLEADSSLVPNAPVVVNPDGFGVSGIVPPAVILIPLEFSYSFTPAPENDDFAHPTVIAGASNNIPLNNYAATVQPGEPFYTDNPGGASIWYSWTAPASGTVVVSLTAPPMPAAPKLELEKLAFSPERIFYDWGGIGYVPGGGSSGFVVIGVIGSGNNWWPPFIWTEVDLEPLPTFAPILSVYDGNTLDSLTLLGRGDTIRFHAEAGKEFRLAFEGAQGTYGFSSMFVVQFAPPANDNFANALSVADASSALGAGSVVSSSREAGEVAPFAGGSVWYRWTAPVYGYSTVTVAANSDGSYFPFGIYSGSNVTNLARLTTATNGIATFFGEEKRDYYLAVYSGDLPEGDFTFQWTGPTYRVLETNVAGLFPRGFTPYLYGTWGSTAFLYKNTDMGWQCAEIEPVMDYATSFLSRPEFALDGRLRIVVTDSDVPSPSVSFRSVRNRILPTIIGIPGQVCDVSVSTDLQTWRTVSTNILSARETFLFPTVNQSTNTFYSVARRFPQSSQPTFTVGVTSATQP